MAHSTTTATSTYVLTRYSKSHPKNGSNSDTQLEWQHFTNPTIHLILDRRKGTELESVRLRILWSMDSNNSNSNDIEDVDLLTFSRLPQRLLGQSSESLPLKAVYRDSLVGIRYLQLPETTEAPVYKRFQITFQDTKAASEFIDLIRLVCPCKANTGPPQARTAHPSASLRPAPAMSSSATLGRTGPGQMSNARTTTNMPFPPSQMEHRYQDQPEHYFSSQTGSSTGMYSSSPPNPSASTLATATPSSSMPPPPLPVSRPSLATFNTVNPQTVDFFTNFNSQQGHTASTMLPSNTQSNLHQSIASSSRSNMHISSTPTSGFPQYPAPFAQQQIFPSLIGSTGPQNQMPQAPLQGYIPENNLDPGASLLASLRNGAGLSELPQPALERIVAEVIREPGFPRLLERLDSMLAVKGLIG